MLSPRHSLLSLAIGVILVGLSMFGCAVMRPTLDKAGQDKVREQYLHAARRDTALSNEKVIKRMRLEEDEYLAQVSAGGLAVRPTYDILIISGGGDYGAFGAGFLTGWGNTANVEHRRPVFDMVTGVSTGALIAPFAFVGNNPSYERIMNLYTEPKKDWFSTRGLLFFLPSNESFADSNGLKRDLTANIDAALVARLAAGSREHRVLGINATNLDVGALHPFSLAIEAEQAEASGDRSRIIDILMASAAIPAIYPPVLIDGAMYVDGGTTSNILYGTNWLSPKAPPAIWKEQYPNEPLAKMRFWVIINNQLHVKAQRVQPTWPDITKASLGTSIRASTATALRHLQTQVELMNKSGIDAEFRYVSIPPDWVSANDRPFDREVMGSLAELGASMGEDPASWKRDFRD